MRQHHLYFLCSLLFALSAILLAFSEPALMAVFIALAGACTTLGIVRIAQRDPDREEGPPRENDRRPH